MHTGSWCAPPLSASTLPPQQTNPNPTDRLAAMARTSALRATLLAAVCAALASAGSITTTTYNSLGCAGGVNSTVTAPTNVCYSGNTLTCTSTSVTYIEYSGASPSRAPAPDAHPTPPHPSTRAPRADANCVTQSGTFSISTGCSPIGNGQSEFFSCSGAAAARVAVAAALAAMLAVMLVAH